MNLTLCCNVEPEPDIAICSSCGWRGPTSQCETETDGSWEECYYEVHVCPECEDGGCVDNYVMSEKQAALWNLWYEETYPTSKSYKPSHGGYPTIK